MEKKKYSNEALINIVIACVIIIIGILFCSSLSYGIGALSWLIGLAIMVAGAISVVNSLVKKKALRTSDGILGSALLAFGLMFIINKLAYLVVVFVPWLMIFVGFALIVDALIRKLVLKAGNLLSFLIALAIGAATFALGFCVKFIPGWADKASLVLGIVLIVYAVFMLVNVVLGEMEKKKE